MLAVPDYVGELPNPVADNHHTAFAGEHQVEFDVTVSVDEIVDVGMLLHVFLGVEHQVFLVFSHIGRFFAVGPLQTGAPGPRQSELHGPALRNEMGEEPLAGLVAVKPSADVIVNLLWIGLVPEGGTTDEPLDCGSRSVVPFTGEQPCT